MCIPFKSEEKYEKMYLSLLTCIGKVMLFQVNRYTVGWVDIGTRTGVQSGFVYFHEKTRKTAKKSFLVK
jgi:hypothetical protein